MIFGANVYPNQQPRQVSVPRNQRIRCMTVGSLYVNHGKPVWISGSVIWAI